MAERKTDAKAAVKGPVKGKKKKLKNALYEIKGENISRKNKFCPKCGAGIFMANHKDRMACGKCGYAEWKPK